MIPNKNKISSLLAVLLLIVSSSPVPVQAVTNGFPDTTNIFSNVGTVLALGTDGQAFQLCSGTLISPIVFLTVAHCADYFNDFLAAQGFTLYLSFGNPIPILELTDVSTLIPVRHRPADPLPSGREPLGLLPPQVFRGWRRHRRSVLVIVREHWHGANDAYAASTEAGPAALFSALHGPE